MNTKNLIQRRLKLERSISDHKTEMRQLEGRLKAHFRCLKGLRVIEIGRVKNRINTLQRIRNKEEQELSSIDYQLSTCF